jgi:hypothetical protein
MVYNTFRPRVKYLARGRGAYNHRPFLKSRFPPCTHMKSDLGLV